MATSKLSSDENFKALSLQYLLAIANFEHRRIMAEIVWLNGKRRKVNTGRLMNINSHNEIPDFMFLENPEGAFECPNSECEIAYASISHVKRHYLTHLTSKPLRCLNYPRCGKYFTRKDNMMSHYRMRCRYGKDVRKRAGNKTKK